MVKRFCWCCNTWRNCRVRRHTTLRSIIPQEIFLQRAMMSVRVFLELLEALLKSENSDRCKYSFPRLHWKEEYPIYRKFCFADRKPFHLISFSFLNQSFSSKPHKTQLVFVALSLVGVTSMACVPSIQSDRSLLGEGHRQDTRERRKSSLPIKAPRLFNNQSEVKEIHFFFPWIITTCAATPIMLGRVNSKASMYSVCARLRLNCFVVALSKDSPTKYFL